MWWTYFCQRDTQCCWLEKQQQGSQPLWRCWWNHITLTLTAPSTLPSVQPTFAFCWAKGFTAKPKPTHGLGGTWILKVLSSSCWRICTWPLLVRTWEEGRKEWLLSLKTVKSLAIFVDSQIYTYRPNLHVPFLISSHSTNATWTILLFSWLFHNLYELTAKSLSPTEASLLSTRPIYQTAYSILLPCCPVVHQI